MSLIGPRPEVPEYVELDDHLWRKVLEVRPGITDLASLAFRKEEAMLAGAADTEEYYRTAILPGKLRLNQPYQRFRSLSHDLALLWMTVRHSFPYRFDGCRIV